MRKKKEKRFFLFRSQNIAIFFFAYFLHSKNSVLRENTDDSMKLDPKQNSNIFEIELEQFLNGVEI